jgi:hypothetical protein
VKRVAHLRAELRALLWAIRCSVVVRRQLHTTSMAEIRLPPRPPVPNNAKHLPMLFLKLVERNCLVRAFIRQEWYAGQGVARTLVIGVRSPKERFGAHAWLEGDPDSWSEGYQELARFPSR